jgi:hypothetical protein
MHILSGSKWYLDKYGTMHMHMYNLVRLLCRIHLGLYISFSYLKDLIKFFTNTEWCNNDKDYEKLTILFSTVKKVKNLISKVWHIVRNYKQNS